MEPRAQDKDNAAPFEKSTAIAATEKNPQPVKAEDIGRNMASDAMNFGVLMKANLMSIRAIEEKLSWLANEIGEFKRMQMKLDESDRNSNERLAKQEELSRIMLERFAKGEEFDRNTGEMLSSLNASIAAISERTSKHDDLNRAVLAVIEDFRARMEDYPTRSEIDPMWKEAETVMLDDLNRQRNDLKALLAALAEDYKDGAISEKTFTETKARTGEKLSAMDDKMKRFAEAFADRAKAKLERPEPPASEKEKLADAKLAEINKREERIALFDRKLDGFSQQVAELARASSSNSDKAAGLEKKLGELAGRLEGLSRAFSSSENRTNGLEGRLQGRRVPPPPRPAPRGLLWKILGAEKAEDGEVIPMMEMEGAWQKRMEPPPARAVPGMAEKMKMPEKVAVELDAPLAAAIMPPPYGLDKRKEERLRQELESLEGILAKLKRNRADMTRPAVMEPTPHGELFLKLRNQKAELEGILRMMEKRRADGAMENASYAEIRTRALNRLSRINEMLGQQK